MLMKLSIITLLTVALTACGSSDNSSGAPLSTSIQGPASFSRGTLAVLSASTSGSVLTDYEWTVISSPAGSSFPVLDVSDDIATLVGGSEGDYEIQLIVSDGDEISSPVTKTLTVVDNGPQPSRAQPQAETDYLFELFFRPDIERQVRSPASVVIIDTPTFTHTGDRGSVRFTFDAANGFGVLLRTRATCSMVWQQGYFWRADLTPEFTLCSLF